MDAHLQLPKGTRSPAARGAVSLPAIPKSREMMTSWTLVGYITWHCQFRTQIEWILQSEDDLKAMGNIKYANALYTNQQPGWFWSNCECGQTTGVRWSWQNRAQSSCSMSA
jgi:hypothetical protein